jgi:NMD protein affecting ribosome stability and mRNA decay
MKRRDLPARPPPRRYDRILKEDIHDTYQQRQKLSGPARCSDCGALFADGRWAWSDDEHAEEEKLLCPACCRIRDEHPAGELRISGGFANAHREEIRNLVTGLAETQAREHPLKRIMKIGADDDGLIVTTTDIHLPHQMGHALHDAFKGEFDVHYDDESYFARVEWRRDE